MSACAGCVKECEDVLKWFYLKLNKLAFRKGNICFELGKHIYIWHIHSFSHRLVKQKPWHSISP